MEVDDVSLVDKSFGSSLADFLADVLRTRAMLDELYDCDLTLANLYLRAIVEEVPVTMLGEIVRSDMFEKLRNLEGFREYEAMVKAEAVAEIKDKVKAEADAKVAAADAKVAEADAKVAEARVQAAQAKAQAAEVEVATTAAILKDLLVLRGDEPSEHALNAIDTCHSAVKLTAWLRRAYLGETAAQLFPDSKI